MTFNFITYDFILWDISPIAFSFGPFVLQWYALVVIIGIVAGRQLLRYLNHDEPFTESIALLTILLSIAGACFVHVIISDPSSIPSRPWELILPLRFVNGTRFAGLQNLSGHGAILGTILACWLSRNRLKAGGFNLLFDRMVIVVSLVAVFLEIAGALNGNTQGRPTSTPLGVVSTHSVVNGLTKISCCIMRSPGGKNPLISADVKKGRPKGKTESGRQPIDLTFLFQAGISEQSATEFLIGDVKEFLFQQNQFIDESGGQPLTFKVNQKNANTYEATVNTRGIARHPIHFYGAIACLIIFILLYRLFFKKSNRHGFTSGFFLIAFGLSYLLITLLRDSSIDAVRMSWLGNVVINIIFMLSGIAMILGAKKSTPSGTSNNTYT